MPENMVEELKEIQRERIALKKRYDEAVKKAHEEGMSNYRIASYLGVGEGAIRMYRKRKGL